MVPAATNAALNDARANIRPARSASPALFASLFATQAVLVALAPGLSEVAADLDVTTAVAGQLRAVTGLIAGVVSLVFGVVARDWPLRGPLSAGLVVLATGSLASAAAPTFVVLAVAQVVTGTGVAIVLSSAVAATGTWSRPDRQSNLLAVTLLGQPSAWIVGLPLIGLATSVSWRLAWIIVPLASSLIALALVRSRTADDPAPRDPHARREVPRSRAIRRWVVGELLAYAGWSGALVYAGALLVESYRLSPGAAGLVLGAAAIGYLPGNFMARRWFDRFGRSTLIVLAGWAAVQAWLFTAVRNGPLLSAALFAALAFVGGARTYAGSAAGLAAAPTMRLTVMSMRASATQFGYLLGAGLGGLALGTAGYTGLAIMLSALFAAAAIPHLTSAPRSRIPRAG